MVKLRTCILVVDLEKAVEQNNENEIKVVQCRFYRSRSRDVKIYLVTENHTWTR